MYLLRTLFIKVYKYADFFFNYVFIKYRNVAEFCESC